MSDSHAHHSPAAASHGDDDKDHAAAEHAGGSHEPAAAHAEHAAPEVNEATKPANGKVKSKYSPEEWSVKLNGHFTVPKAFMSEEVVEKIDALNLLSARKRLAKKNELLDVIAEHNLFNPESSSAQHLPPGWHELGAIRATHKFVKVEANGDLTFKKDTFWTRMAHKARHVVAFFGFRPLMRV